MATKPELSTINTDNVVSWLVNPNSGNHRDHIY